MAPTVMRTATRMKSELLFCTAVTVHVSVPAISGKSVILVPP